MKAQVKKQYQEFVDEINFPTIIYIYETGKVISYNKQALELIGKPIVNVSKLREANPKLVMTKEMMENRSTILYNQRFCAENQVLIEIDCEINSVCLQDRHLVLVFFEYSFKQMFCHKYSKLLPRMFWLNKQHQIQGTNESFRKEQGYFGQELLPEQLEEILDEQTTTHIIQEFDRLLESKKPVFNILQLMQPFREMSYFCKMNCVPAYNRNGTVIGLFAVYMLIFNREEYEQFFSTSLGENNILNHMICNTNMVVISWSKDIRYHLHYVSSNISNMGYTPEECYTGKVKLQDIMSEQVSASFMDNLHKIEEGSKNSFNQSMQIRKADGSLCWITLYVGINKRNNKTFFYECFAQELMNEPSYKVRDKENVFYMALPTVTNERKELLESRQNHFCAYYQPIFQVGTKKAFAVEAMLRLKRGSEQVTDPRSVLTPAESIALKTSLGEWFIQDAIRDFVKLKKCTRDPLEIYLEINSLQVMQPNYVQTIRRIVVDNGIVPGEVVLEMKESIAVENEQLMIEIIREYKAEGFRIVLTGFRGGAFSLLRLKSLDIDGLKFDKEVLKAYYSNLLSADILEKEIEYITSLGIYVLIDGVETKQQYNYIAAKKVYACQGNYLSVPLSYDNMSKRLRE